MRPRLALRVILFSAIVAGAAQVAPAQTADDLFDDQVLHRVDVYINSKDWLLLKRNYGTNTHYPADMRWRGLAVRNAAVRSRGGDSRSGVKPGLHLNFDHYASGQTFLGLRSLVLKNLVQDASAMREFLTFKMLRRLGVPAPREAFATLYVNNAYAGLYAVVENVDATFAQRVFGESSGSLFEYKYLNEWRFEYLGADLAPYAGRFDPVTHEYDSPTSLYGPFEEWCRFANESPSEQFAVGIARYVDAIATIRLNAAQAFMAEPDGLAGKWGLHNLSVYRTAGTTVHRFIAWDEDRSCDAPGYIVTLGQHENVLLDRLMRMPDVNQAFYATLLQAATYADEDALAAGATALRQDRSAAAATRTADVRGSPRRSAGGDAAPVRGPGGRPLTGSAAPGWLHSEALRVRSLIQPAVYRDTLKPWTNQEFEADAAYVVEFCRGRAATVRAQVEWLTSR